MAAIPLSPPSIATLKKALLDEFNDVKSSHLTEALAAAAGFKTHASLQAELAAHASDPPYVCLKDELFRRRLIALGYPDDPEFSFDVMDTKTSGLVRTVPDSAYAIDYKGKRALAFRNLMVSVINEGLRQKVFSLRPGDNRWPSSEERGHLYRFSLPSGLPVLVSVHDAGFDELSINVAANPIGERVRASSAGLYAGDAVGETWLERRDGAWMQSAKSLFSCRKALLDHLSTMNVEPLGFGDRGRVIM